MVSAQVNGISLLLSMGVKVGKPTLNFYSTAIKGAEQPKEAASPLKGTVALILYGSKSANFAEPTTQDMVRLR